jgi:hypothetical protein
VADIYFGEFMRVLDHLCARYIVGVMQEKGTSDPKAGFLKEKTEDWLSANFKEGGEKISDAAISWKIRAKALARCLSKISGAGCSSRQIPSHKALQSRVRLRWYGSISSGATEIGIPPGRVVGFPANCRSEAALPVTSPDSR